MVETEDQRGRAAYANSTGDTAIWRRQPRQLQSTLAFMLGKNEGRLFRLRAAEVEDVRSCQVWLRKHNPHVQLLLTNAERFDSLYTHLQTVIPEGRNDAPIRIKRSPRLTANVESAIGTTLGEEQAVLVVVDPKELPRNYVSVDVLAEKIGDSTYRAHVEGSNSPEGHELPSDWGPRMSAAADELRKSSKVTLGDAHLDAKAFVQWHPYGTGSLRCEDHGTSMAEYQKNRLLSLQHDFRRSPVWSFFQLDRLIKNDLYFKERRRRQAGHAKAEADQSVPKEGETGGGRSRKRTGEDAGLGDSSTANDKAAVERQDNYAKLFGRVDPRHIPESSGWWRQQQSQLMAISADHENGLMTGMVTMTQNDNSAELLAHARRGPCAKPTKKEKIAYLLTRRAPKDRRPPVQRDATAAVLSYQRRVHVMKHHFFKRHKRTPLGKGTAFWDRTEAQTRGALHAHILYWNKRRRLNPDTYKPRPAIPEEQNRRWDAKAAGSPPMNTEDDVYHRTETARVHAELVRLRLDEPLLHPRMTLLFAFLLRAKQTLLYIHSCTSLYCMKNRSSCRFFFPWPEQLEQQYCETTQRLALRRRLLEDDQWVVPHNLELMAFSPATINVLLFDFMRGADQCRSYACKYCGKPEPWYYLVTEGEEANGVKRFLQTRNTGLPMAHNRLLGNHVVRSTVHTQFLWTQFTVDPKNRIQRTPEHAEKVRAYPDPEYYLNELQYYFFRSAQLKELRPGQFFRYYTHRDDENARKSPAVRTDENTLQVDDSDVIPDNVSHQNFHEESSALPAGTTLACRNGIGVKCSSARRRHNRDLCVVRVPPLEPCGCSRESYYEQKLLLGLPWHCYKKPAKVSRNNETGTRWFFQTDAPYTPEDLQRFTMTDRALDKDGETFENMCLRIEQA